MFQRIRDAISRWWHRVESTYPVEAIAAERDELREEVMRTRRVLQEAATERARLESGVREDSAAAENLALQVSDSLARGNREEAGEAALRMEELERGLAEKRKLLERADRSYKEALDRTVVAQEEYRRRSAELEARQSQIQAKAAAAAQAQLSEKLGALDAARDRDRVSHQQAAAAAGAARVADDLARAEAAQSDREREQRKAKAEEALARFATARKSGPPAPASPAAGANKPAPPPPPRAEKTIGPAQS